MLLHNALYNHGVTQFSKCNTKFCGQSASSISEVFESVEVVLI